MALRSEGEERGRESNAASEDEWCAERVVEDSRDTGRHRCGVETLLCGEVTCNVHVFYQM